MRAAVSRLLAAAPPPEGSVRRRDVPLRAIPAVVGPSWDGADGFRFQGIERRIGAPPDWTAAPTRLWAYHLHYLEALRERAIPAPSRRRLLESWIDGNRHGRGTGWEPYPISLRLVNALEFLAGEPGDDAAILAWLAHHAARLSRQIERDVGANHLWKNGMALAFAGRLLEAPGAPAWRRRGDAIVDATVDRQLLADGFHYEATPTYHALFVEDLIRLRDLLVACGEGDSPRGRRLAEAVGRAGDALASVLHLDGEIPLFNDSAFGQAPPAAFLLAGAARAAGRAIAPHPHGAVSAGLFRLDGVESRILIDGGETGCRDQPGHAHADTFSFELSARGRRVFVDSGVHDYEDSGERKASRSTRGHNTVEIDGVDQSEVWGVFRVGRRARPFDLRFAPADSGTVFEGAHDGYRHLPGAPVHRRRFERVGDDAWRVVDRVEGGGRHAAVGRLRFGPDFRPVRTAEGTWEAAAPGVRVRVSFEAGPRLALVHGAYFPSMGTSLPVAVLEARSDGALPIETAFRIEIEAVP